MCKTATGYLVPEVRRKQSVGALEYDPVKHAQEQKQR